MRHCDVSGSDAIRRREVDVGESVLEAAGFDEAWYLVTYRDVGEAVRAGDFASGHDHFRRFGRAEGRVPHAGGQPQLTDEERQRRVSDVWSVAPGVAPGWYWLAHPLVRARVNTFASGNPNVDGYGRLKLLLRERGVALPLGRAVSLGCGFGALERNLAAEGIIREIDAYDIAPEAVAGARRLAAEAGLDGLRYHVADLEHVAFAPGEIDVVFAHSSVHHVERLEALFATVAAMLKPGGIFHLNEYVGPNRFQWTDAQMAGINEFLQALPDRLRRMPSGHLRPLQTRPTIAAMVASDPSEAIRSSDIVPLIGQYFDILEQRDLGGALLHQGLGEIAQNFDAGSAEDRAVLEAFFAAEDRAMREGAIGSDFTLITAVARPRVAMSAQPPACHLSLPPGFALPDMATEVAAGDTMFDGRSNHYLAVGQSALACIEAALGRRTPRVILDLPCGYGRVTRMLRARFPEAVIVGSDLDRPGVDWVAARFGAVPAYSVPDLGRLALDRRFDLVWVGSLFTHISERQALALLGVLARHLTRDGVVVASSHGPTIIGALSDAGYRLEPRDAAGVLDDYGERGYGHRAYGGTGEYGISLTDRNWWAAAAARCGLRLLAYRPQAWDGHQDIVVLSRAPWVRRLAPRTLDLRKWEPERRLLAAYDPCIRDFDSAYYLRRYPDVAEAVAAGTFATAYAHFSAAGRAEGRQPNANWAPPGQAATPIPPESPFDEAWYLRTFPDVAAAIATGAVPSAFDHWLTWGRPEGRPEHPSVLGTEKEGARCRMP